MSPADIVVTVLVGAAFLLLLRLATTKSRSAEIRPFEPTPDFGPNAMPLRAPERLPLPEEIGRAHV